MAKQKWSRSSAVASTIAPCPLPSSPSPTPASHTVPSSRAPSYSPIVLSPPHIDMAPAAPTPEWVKKLKPSGVQGSELLAAERNKSNIDVEGLSRFLFTQEGLDRKRRILKILQSEKVFDKSQNYFAGRVDRFETALARAKKLRQIGVHHKWTQEDRIVANDLISEPGPYGLHESMFLVCAAPIRAVPQTIHSLTPARSPSAIKVPPSSTRSF